MNSTTESDLRTNARRRTPHLNYSLLELNEVTTGFIAPGGRALHHALPYFDGRHPLAPPRRPRRGPRGLQMPRTRRGF